MWLVCGIPFHFAQLFMNSRFLPRNRLAAMKAHQATQPFPSSFLGFVMNRLVAMKNCEVARTRTMCFYMLLEFS